MFKVNNKGPLQYTSRTTFTRNTWLTLRSLLKQRNSRKIWTLQQQKINSFKTNILSAHILGHEDKGAIFFLKQQNKTEERQNAQKCIKKWVIFYYFQKLALSCKQVLHAIKYSLTTLIHFFFYKQSIFDHRPENCLSFSKKLPPKVVQQLLSRWSINFYCLNNQTF